MSALAQKILHSHTLKGVLKTSLIMPLGMALLFVMNVLLAKSLGVTEFGGFSFAIQIATILAIVLSGGLANSMQKNIPAFFNTNDNTYKAYMTWSTSYLCGSLTLVLLVWASPLRDLTIAKSTVSVGNVALPVAAFLCWLWQRYYFLGKNEIVSALLYRDLIFPALILIYILLVRPKEYKSLIVVYSLSLFVLTAIPVLREIIASNFSGYYPKMTSIRNIIGWHKVAAPMAVTSLMQLGLNSWDIILIGIFLGMSDAGIYSISLKLALVLGLVARVVNISLAQRMSFLYANGRKRQLDKLISISIVISCAFGVAVFVFLLIFGKPLLGIIGDEYEGGYLLLLLLSFGQLIVCVTGPIATYLNMTNGQKKLAITLTRWSLIAVGVNCVVLQYKPVIWCAGVSVSCIFMMKIEQIYYFFRLRNAKVSERI